MKTVKILGLVVAVHVVAFVVIFANPGCRSTSSTGTDATPIAASSTPSTNDEYAPVTPVPVNDSSAQPSISYSAQPEGRYAPTRPDAVTDVSSEITPASSYTVARGDSLWSIAHKNGISVAELTAANNLHGKATLQVGQKLLIPSKSASSAGTTATAADSGKTYTVKSGDTLSTIASRNGTTISALRAANNIRGDMVRVGQELKIPENASPAPASVETPKASSSSTSATAAPAGQTTHVVKSGDTLGAIARRYKVSVAEIAKANNITDPTRIVIGQELIIPGAGYVPPPAKVTTTPTSTPPPAVEATPVQPATNTPSDLDANLPPDFIDAPVIEVEKSGAPKIE